MSKLTKLMRDPAAFVEDSRVTRWARSKSRLAWISRHIGSANSLSGRAAFTDLDAAAQLFKFRDAMPVNAIRYGDLRLWPALRSFLWVRLAHATKGSRKVSSVNPYRYSIEKAWRQSYKEDLEIGELDALPEAEVDFLFFTNLRGTEQTLLNGLIYNRITDPIFEAACKVGRAAKVEFIRGVGQVSLGRTHTPHFVLPSVTRQIGHFFHVEAPGNLLKVMSDKVPAAQVNRAALVDCIEWFFHARSLFARVLRKIRPRIVLFIGYDHYMPLILAVRDAGLMSVDLQHGVQAGWSPLYNDWREIPPAGYDLLPDVFWVWGDDDADNIRRVFGSRHRAVVGGFPWLRRVAPADRLDLREHSAIQSGERIGLITLQDQLVFPQLFRDIVHATRGDIRWFVKRHPKFPKIDVSGVTDAVISSEVEAEPFRSLAAQADVHLTECSTAVVEADFEGVVNFVSGRQGAANYRRAIARGHVFHVDTVSEFMHALARVPSARRDGHRELVRDVDPCSVLQGLLEESR